MKKVFRELNDTQNFFLYNNTNSVLEEFREYSILSRINNPKIIGIVRDENSKIISSNINLFNNDMIYDLDFDENMIDKIYEVVIDDEYYYKGITIDLSDVTDNTQGYIQLLIDVDTEKALVGVYQRIIIWSVLFGIGISVIASVIISRKSLEPVANMIKKQNEFVQNVSHELRTPLTIIQAKQELLLSEPNAKIIDKSEEISLTLSEAKRMSKLTKDLMVLSRADNKQMVLNKEEIDIDEFLTNISKNYIEIIELQEKSFQLHLNYKELISIDVNKFYQVMVILLDNSMKYTEKRR